MAEKDKALQELDDLFAAARAGRPELGEGLEQAILADAARVQAERQAAAQPAPRRRGGAQRLRQMVAALGGWPALGGLAAASAAGLWVGLAPPSFVPDPVELAGYGSASAETVPYDSYDIAVLLDEEMQ